MEEENNNINEDLLADIPEEYVSGGEYREKLESLKPVRPEQVGWKQKFAVVFLILFGMSAVVLWAIQFQSGLQIRQRVVQNGGVNNSAAKSPEQITADELRDKDTDEDGLSDYDEIYFYETSIYLDDTDSDGLSDKEELEAGDDPNCPRGQSCFNSEPAADTSSNAAGDSQNYLEDQPELNVEGINDYLKESEAGVSQDSQRDVLQKILEGNADAQTLRSLLLQAGVDENMLNQISDEQLLNLYNQTLTSPSP